MMMIRRHYHHTHSSVYKIIHTLISLIMFIALNCHVNNNSNSKRNNNTNNNINNNNNGYVFVLVNSPKNVLKTRFLFLLNNCHSNLKRIKMNDRKKKESKTHKPLDLTLFCQYCRIALLIVLFFRGIWIYLESQKGEREREKTLEKKCKQNWCLLFFFCSKLVLFFIYSSNVPRLQFTIQQCVSCYFFVFFCLFSFHYTSTTKCIYLYVLCVYNVPFSLSFFSVIFLCFRT